MVCPLCQKEKPLVQSHVIPEFLYRPLYDEKHRAIEAKLVPKGFNYLQKAYREPLPCSECEGTSADLRLTSPLRGISKESALTRSTTVLSR